MTTDAQSERTTGVDVRVWQRVSNLADLAISIRPEGHRWADFDTVPLEMSGLDESRRYRYGDITAAGFEIRVWQGLSNLRSLHISARPEGGSWADFPTSPLDMRGLDDTGRWRYGDIALRVAVPADVPPELEPTPTPDATQTQESTEDVDTVLSLSVGEMHTCALWESGTLACWGDNVYGQTDVPEGRYRSVSVGIGYTCAVRDTGRLLCWGNDSWSVTEDVPEGSYRSVSSSVWHACAIRESGEVDCWGWNEHGQAEPPGGTFRSVSTGSRHTCGLRHSGQIECWGSNEDGRADVPAGSYRSVSAGELSHLRRARVRTPGVLGSERWPLDESAGGPLLLRQRRKPTHLRPWRARRGEMLGVRILWTARPTSWDLSAGRDGRQPLLRCPAVRGDHVLGRPERSLRKDRPSGGRLPVGERRR